MFFSCHDDTNTEKNDWKVNLQMKSKDIAVLFQRVE